MSMFATMADFHGFVKQPDKHAFSHPTETFRHFRKRLLHEPTHWKHTRRAIQRSRAVEIARRAKITGCRSADRPTRSGASRAFCFGTAKGRGGIVEITVASLRLLASPGRDRPAWPPVLRSIAIGLTGQVFGPRSPDHVPAQCQIRDIEGEWSPSNDTDQEMNPLQPLLVGTGTSVDALRERLGHLLACLARKHGEER
jgi:hypothetical protein